MKLRSSTKRTSLEIKKSVSNSLGNKLKKEINKSTNFKSENAVSNDLPLKYEEHDENANGSSKIVPRKEELPAIEEKTHGTKKNGKRVKVKQENDQRILKESVKSSSSSRSSAKLTPPHWELVFEKIEKYRQENPAPIDTMGCERLADSLDPKVFRYETLVSLQLSSQTKDEVTAAAVQSLKKLPGGLTPSSILSITSEELNQIIQKVGFHKRKTQYMIDTAKLLVDKYDSDIPPTVEELMELPGIGPKMAYLCMQAAWFQNVGIGVDTHVHRISNRLGWVKTKTPENTRLALEEWLPTTKWTPVNSLLVGFGQTHCFPLRPKCSTCPIKDLCPKVDVKDAK